MAGLCKAVLIGHLGRDPEIKYTPDGLAICNFSIAATEKVKGEDKTQWFKIITFGKLAEICSQYLIKGKQVYVEGRLQTNEWEIKQGEKRFAVEVIASTMQMLGTKSDSGQVTRQQAAPPRPPTGELQRAIAEKNKAVHEFKFGDDTDTENIPEGDIPF